LIYGLLVTQKIIDVSNYQIMKSLSWLFQIVVYSELKLTIFKLIKIILNINIGGQRDSMLFILMINICYQDIIQIYQLKSGIYKKMKQEKITYKVTKRTELSIVVSLVEVKSLLQLTQKN
jgi:hypothetical protein